MSIALLPAAATLDDLMTVDGKAELIAGRIVRYMPSGELPGFVALEIAVHLRAYAKATGRGRAYADNVGYALPFPLPNGRQSFSPDASFYTGPLGADRMRFIDGVPALAVEVRSECDYGSAAEREMAERRADYFQAGTAVVWDVDPLAETVTRYQAGDPDHPVIYRSGDQADAEPALPGWRVAVAEVFKD